MEYLAMSSSHSVLVGILSVMFSVMEGLCPTAFYREQFLDHLFHRRWFYNRKHLESDINNIAETFSLERNRFRKNHKSIFRKV
jgi:hypothetical protein